MVAGGVRHRHGLEATAGAERQRARFVHGGEDSSGQAVEQGDHGLESSDRIGSDRVEHQLHVAHAFGGELAQRGGQRCGVAGQRPRLGCGAVAHRATEGIGKGDEQGGGALHLGRIATGRAAGGVDPATQRAVSVDAVVEPGEPGVPCLDVRQGDAQHALARPSRPSAAGHRAAVRAASARSRAAGSRCPRSRSARRGAACG